jgi:hypothetical protein
MYKIRQYMRMLSRPFYHVEKRTAYRETKTFVPQKFSLVSV